MTPLGLRSSSVRPGELIPCMTVEEAPRAGGGGQPRAGPADRVRVGGVRDPGAPFPNRRPHQEGGDQVERTRKAHAV